MKSSYWGGKMPDFNSFLFESKKEDDEEDEELDDVQKEDDDEDDEDAQEEDTQEESQEDEEDAQDDDEDEDLDNPSEKIKVRIEGEEGHITFDQLKSAIKSGLSINIIGDEAEDFDIRETDVYKHWKDESEFSPTLDNNGL